MKTIGKIKNSIKRSYPGIAVLLIMLILSGCANPYAKTSSDIDDETLEKASERADMHVASLADSMDEEAIVVSVNTIESSMQFYNLSVGRTYTLSYNGLTNIKNRFGDAIVAGQLKEGDVARVTFLKDSRLVKSVSLRETEELNLVCENAPFNMTARTAVIDDVSYKINNNVPIVSGGKLIKYEELNPVDELKIETSSNEILSIAVSKGHGYLRLEGHDPFVGGWIEVGTTIAPVEEEMLLSVPEGDYEMCITKDNTQGLKKISIEKDKETVVDLTEMETAQIKKTGKIFFTVSPETAKLYIDGEEKDYSEEIELLYGIHQMTAKAPGYVGLTQYFKVGQDMANLNIELKKSESDDDDDEEEIISANTADTATSASEHRVFIDAPEGAELYLNGSYIGVVPTSFSKKEGSYVISLRKEGYQTRSYTLHIDDADKDQTYSFSELIEAKKSSDTPSTSLQ